MIFLGTFKHWQQTMFYDYNSFFFVISPSKNESFWEFSGILELFSGNSGKNFRPYFGNYVANPINYECWFISHPILKLSRYLCARASNITLLVSLFYMWRVYQAAALVYESVSKERSSGADPEGRRGGLGGWPFRTAHLKRNWYTEKQPEIRGSQKI